MISAIEYEDLEEYDRILFDIVNFKEKEKATLAYIEDAESKDDTGKKYAGCILGSIFLAHHRVKQLECLIWLFSFWKKNPDHELTEWQHLQSLISYQTFIEVSYDCTEISLEKSFSVIEMMKQRFDEEIGTNYYLPISVEISLYSKIGNRKKLKELMPLFESSQKDETFCPGCTQWEVGTAYYLLNQYDDAERVINSAMKHAEDECGHMGSCQLVLLKCYVLTGRMEEAKQLYRKIDRLWKSKNFANSYISSLRIYCLFKFGEYSKALSEFCNGVQLMIEDSNKDNIFYFAHWSSVLLEEVHKERSEIKLYLTKNFELYRDDNTYPLAELIPYFQKIAQRNGDAYDKRNGTDFYKEKLAVKDRIL